MLLCASEGRGMENEMEHLLSSPEGIASHANALCRSSMSSQLGVPASMHAG